MSPAITSARNPMQLPVSLVARNVDGVPSRAASAKIFIVMTQIPRQRATNSGLLVVSRSFAEFSSPATSAGTHRGPAPNDDKIRFPHSG